MQQYFFALLVGMLALQVQASAQQLPRTFGARAFSIDDGTSPVKTLQLDVIAPLSVSYQIHFPPAPPTGGTSFFAIDINGNARWETKVLPSLPPGNLWYGNALSEATNLPAGPVGSVLTISDGGLGVPKPLWSTTIPSQVSITASQIHSGTIQPGVNITVGAGASLGPSGGGTVAANQLVGAGPGKYSDAVPIPPLTISMDITCTGIVSGSIVVVSVRDPNAAEFTVIANVTSVTPGVGFTVTFTAPYPNPAGSLNYAVINP